MRKTFQCHAPRFLSFSFALLALVLLIEVSYPRKPVALGPPDNQSLKAKNLSLSNPNKKVSSPGKKANSATDDVSMSLPLSFESVDNNQFLFRGRRYQLLLTPSRATIAPNAGARHIARINLIGASAAARGEALDPLPGKRNYLIGNEPAKWRTDVPTYSRVRYDEVYKGIDLIYYGRENHLEYDFQIAPGADPHRIKLAFSPEFRPRVTSDGDLIVVLEVIFAPVIY